MNEKQKGIHPTHEGAWLVLFLGLLLCIAAMH